MTPQQRDELKVNLVSKAYSELMKVVARGITPYEVEQILTKLVEEAYEAGREVGIERMIKINTK